MIKHCKYFVLFGFFLLFSFSFNSRAFAATLIADSANMLTTEEAEELKTYCNTILKQYNTSVYIVTSNTIGQQDDFEGYMEQIGNAKDAPQNMVLLFVSTKPNGHVYQIFGYGRAENYLTTRRCDKVMDHMQKDLSNKEYFSALQTFCEEVQRYLGRDPKFDSLFFQPIPQLIFALFLSALIIFVMVRNTAGRNTTTVNTYIDQEHSMLLGRMDHFTHMTVSRVKKSNNSNGRSSGGGGRSHSSGHPHSF